MGTLPETGTHISSTHSLYCCVPQAASLSLLFTCSTRFTRAYKMNSFRLNSNTDQEQISAILL